MNDATYFFFFAFLVFFLATFFLAFFFAAIGMQLRLVSSGVQRIVRPPKRKQYEWVAFSNAISTGFSEKREFIEVQ